MIALLEIVLSNVVMAGLLAVLALGLGRVCRRPALRHSLWLLVLLKLVTPPLVQLPLPWPVPATSPGNVVSEKALAQQEKPAAKIPAQVDGVPTPPLVPDIFPPDADAGQQADSAANFPSSAEASKALVPQKSVTDNGKPEVDNAIAKADDDNNLLPLLNAPDEAKGEDQTSNAEQFFPVFPFSSSSILLGLAWLIGSLLWFSLAICRLRRFAVLLRQARPATAEIETETARLAAKFGLARWPRVWLVPGALSPMLWAVGRSPRLLLPLGLLERLDATQRSTLLAHELAHWHRRDHWVRWLELVVMGLYWWCPLAWWARRELSEAEEDCCDAWVVWALPGAARAYATALVDTLDFLANAPRGLPLAARAVGQLSVLRRRLTMIMRGATPRNLPRFGLAAVFGLGLFLLPLVPSRAIPGEEQTDIVQVQNQGGGDSKVQDEIDKLKKQLEALQAKVAKDSAAKEEKNKHELDKLFKQLKDVNDKYTAEQHDHLKQVKALQDQIQKLGGKVPGTHGSTLWPPPPYAPTQPPTTDPKPPATGWQPNSPGSPSPGDLEKRVKGLEKKVEMLMKELHKKHPSTPGATPGFGQPGTGFPGGPGTPGMPGGPGAGGPSGFPGAPGSGGPGFPVGSGGPGGNPSGPGIPGGPGIGGPGGGPSSPGIPGGPGIGGPGDPFQPNPGAGKPGLPPGGATPPPGGPSGFSYSVVQQQ